jgi:hypothetical protein
MRTAALGATTLTWLLLVVTPQAVGDSVLQRRTLVGLKGVHVLVEAINPDAEKDGLSRTLLQTDIELKLRRAGVPVFTEEETFGVPGSPVLDLDVGLLKNPSGVYAFGVDLALIQEVNLTRAPRVEIGAATWRATSTIGIVGTAKLSSVRETVKDKVDQFINAYLAANPKK